MENGGTMRGFYSKTSFSQCGRFSPTTPHASYSYSSNAATSSKSTKAFSYEDEDMEGLGESKDSSESLVRKEGTAEREGEGGGPTNQLSIVPRRGRRLGSSASDSTSASSSSSVWSERGMKERALRGMGGASVWARRGVRPSKDASALARVVFRYPVDTVEVLILRGGGEGEGTGTGLRRGFEGEVKGRAAKCWYSVR